MYKLDYPDYVSSLDDGVENPTQTISIGDSLSYKKITNETLLKGDIEDTILEKMKF
jgi:hypothetical protein